LEVKFEAGAGDFIETTVIPEETTMGGPLSGIRVLDFSEGAQGPYAAALLADMGAEVIKVERPGRGDLMRESPPFKNSVSLCCVTINRGKKSVILDLKSPDDIRKALSIARHCDVVLENWRPGVADRLGVGYDTIAAVNPQVVYAASSGFGRTGPYRRKPCMDPIAQAISGLTSISGAPDGEGEKLRFVLADFFSAMITCEGILAGLYAREATGRGQRVDSSQLEAIMYMQVQRLTEYLLTGVKPVPMGSACPEIVPSRAFATADGFVAVETPTDASWTALCEALDEPQWARHTQFASNSARMANRVALEALLEAKFRTGRAARWAAKLEMVGVPCARVFRTLVDALEDGFLFEAGFVRKLTHPQAGWVLLPEVPWSFNRTPALTERLAPDLGEHTEEILHDCSVGPVARETTRGKIRSGGPLTGIKVLDFTQGDAGPFATMHLADLGAEVIKIEPPEGDWMRALGASVFAGISASFAGLNRNKHGLVLDLNDAASRAQVGKLAADADVIVHNFSPAVADTLGITFSRYSAMNPRLIFCAITAFGSASRLRGKPASELILQALTGVMGYVGSADQPPYRVGMNVAAAAAGVTAAQAVLAALIWRSRTGEGQAIEVSAIIALLSLMNNYLASRSEPDEPISFARSHLWPPDTGFKTMDGRVDFVIRVEENWAEFCRRIGATNVLGDPRFSSWWKRVDNLAELRQALASAMRQKTTGEVLRILNELDALCAPMHDYETLLRDPQVREDQMLLELQTPDGPFPTIGVPWKFGVTPVTVRLAPPRLTAKEQELPNHQASFTFGSA
jgi:crotonobetainyl-CoA:carnitine CoA-transferase CaiB-like acyl-CoA transferase